MLSFELWRRRVPGKKSKGHQTVKKYLLSMLKLSLAAGFSAVIFAGTAEAAAPIKSRGQCMHMWKAYKTRYEAKGKSRETFMRECRPGVERPGAAKGTRTP
jgi:hypothetical protein